MATPRSLLELPARIQKYGAVIGAYDPGGGGRTVIWWQLPPRVGGHHHKVRGNPPSPCACTGLSKHSDPVLPSFSWFFLTAVFVVRNGM